MRGGPNLQDVNGPCADMLRVQSTGCMLKILSLVALGLIVWDCGLTFAAYASSGVYAPSPVPGATLPMAAGFGAGLYVLMAGDATWMALLGAVALSLGSVTGGFAFNQLVQAGAMSNANQFLNGTVANYRTSTFSGGGTSAAAAYSSSVQFNSWRCALLFLQMFASICGAGALIFLVVTANVGPLMHVAPAPRAAVGYDRRHYRSVAPYSSRFQEYFEDFCCGWRRHNMTGCSSLAYVVIVLKTLVAHAVFFLALTYGGIGLTVGGTGNTPSYVMTNDYENPLFGAVLMTMVHAFEFDTLGTNTKYCMQRKTFWYLSAWLVHLFAFVAAACGTVQQAAVQNSNAACAFASYASAPSCYGDYACVERMRATTATFSQISSPPRSAGDCTSALPQYTLVTLVSASADAQNFAYYTSTLAQLQIALTSLCGVSLALQTFWNLQLWTTSRVNLWAHAT